MIENTQMDSIARAVRNGHPLDFLVIDSHGHIGDTACLAHANTSAKEIITALDKTGVNRMAISATFSAIGVDRRIGNDLVIDAITKHPNRFIGYCTLFPDDAQKNIDEIKRCQLAGVHAIKIHTSTGKPYTDSSYQPAFAYANELGMPILAHTWGKADCDILANLACEYQSIKWIAGHCPVDFNAYVSLAKKCENVFLELCFSGSPYGLVEFYSKEVGAHRILFGSDCALNSIGSSIGRVAFADISLADKYAILGKNAASIFSINDKLND